MTTQSGFPCVGGAPEATSIANFDDHLSRGSVIADSQIWMVRLRRGHKYVIVAIGLSRRSAEALAEEINELL